MPLETVLSLLSLVGVGGIVAAFFTYFWQKRKDILLKENELKEKRYLCILLLMYAHIDPKAFESLKPYRPDIKSKDDLKRELNTEWVNSWIFASDDTIKSFKKFLNEPTENSFAETVLAMRKELWGKKSNLPRSTFSLEALH
ncbi:MAG: hypothetical protein HYY22_09245 [Thaumarchaeota archaeon]|nr:hypothetical protein [Nitrososphaerota archaeon]